jgi:hypothetical protein
MAYATGNPKTKKALRQAVANGERPLVFSVGVFPAKQNGRETVEGPHYPQPHRWYAVVEVENGVIVRVVK